MELNSTNTSKPPDSKLPSLRRLKLWVWFKERAHPTDLQVTLFWAGIVGLS
jgi:hypothetical protein